MVGNLDDGFKHGFGTLGTQFVDHQTLLTGGHDGVLRQWDLRTVSFITETFLVLDHTD